VKDFKLISIQSSHIDGMSAGTAYAKAKELCPKGYAIIGNPRQTSVLDYEMTIECR
jgi:hypothetical protein